MYMAKRIAMLLCIALCAISFNLYAQSEINAVRETVIFVDVSKSMEDGFTELQRHIVDAVIAEVPRNSHLTIFQFYRNMERVYEGAITSQTERYKAADAVYALHPDLAWTNFTPIFDYIAKHNAPDAQFFIFSDGIEEVERDKSAFILTKETLQTALPGLAFTKDERSPYAYSICAPLPVETGAAAQKNTSKHLKTPTV